jgi:uncharacterized membrane protein
MSLTIIFITVIVSTLIILFYIYSQTTKLFEKSEIESNALGDGVDAALTAMEKRLSEKLNNLTETVEKRIDEVEDKIKDLNRL